MASGAQVQCTHLHSTFSRRPLRLAPLTAASQQTQPRGHGLISCAAARDAHATVPAVASMLSRRAALSALSLAATSLVLPVQPGSAAGRKLAATVGSYLPPAGIDDFVEFVPDKNKTPAIRAGTVDKDNPYRFALPPSWREKPVANIQSGNYCQPRCAEPWTEVIFEDTEEGEAKVIVSPLVRLTNRANATITDIGTPDNVIQSIGAFITGTYVEPEDVLKTDVRQIDGRTYYVYEINAPYGTFGPHTVSALTTKGDLALLFVLGANAKQWPKSQDKLRKVLTTFRA